MAGKPRALASVSTAGNPGAIAIIQLSGTGVESILSGLTGRSDWPRGRMRYVSLGDIDDGLAVMLRDDWGQLMPHGGLRVVREILDRLVGLGVEVADGLSARDIYPEAESELEADMLAAMARAASPVAVDLLAGQVELWRKWVRDGCCAGDVQGIGERTNSLDLLVTPPAVAVVGRPNVGKSTLTNRMLGKSASIVADLPGTTRDWVAALTEIEGVVVRWLDTPGLRESDDPIEQNAIELSRLIIAEAEVVVAMRDGELSFPDGDALPREADFYVVNKADLVPESVGDNVLTGDGSAAATPLPISAMTGVGVDNLQAGIIEKLGLGDIGSQELWAFSEKLKEMVGSGDWKGLKGYTSG